MMQPHEVSEAVHSLVHGLPRHTYQAALTEVPVNGIYFFFERGEEVSLGERMVKRIVRIGTHRADGRLAKRLRQHISGNRRASVFRRHLGGALLVKDDAQDQRLAGWLTQKGSPMPDVEQAVTQTLREQFPFCCIRVDDAAERLVLERGLIALLARHPLGPPSQGWLGWHAMHPAIQQSGLWNTQHVHVEPLGLEAFAGLELLAGNPG
jgi:hypothetical protein